MTQLLAFLVSVPLASAATLTPVATPPTIVASPAATSSPATESPSPLLLAPTRTPTPAPRWTATPELAPDDDPTPIEDPDAPGDEPPRAMPLSEATNAPVGPVRAFRTPEREAPPAFVAPRLELPEADDERPDDPASDAMPSPDLPYIATVTFRAQAAAEISGFELFVIYPRSGGDFVGSGRGVECRKPGDGALVADDNDAGALRIRVVNGPPLTFPLDVVCKFTVEPNAVLHARLIAVNVASVTAGSTPGDPSTLTVSVSAR
jgi:hypothetical protein